MIIINNMIIPFLNNNAFFLLAALLADSFLLDPGFSHFILIFLLFMFRKDQFQRTVAAMSNLKSTMADISYCKLY